MKKSSKKEVNEEENTLLDDLDKIDDKNKEVENKEKSKDDANNTNDNSNSDKSGNNDTPDIVSAFVNNDMEEVKRQISAKVVSTVNDIVNGTPEEVKPENSEKEE